MEVLHPLAPNLHKKGTELGERSLTYHYFRNTSKAMVIISHSDLDGVTSALNMLYGAFIMGFDAYVYLERSSTEETSTELAVYAYNELKKHLHTYNEVEIAFTDRMFMNPQEFLKNVSLEHTLGKTLKFTWYDHHEGNFRSREELNNKFGIPGIDVFEDYAVITDIDHCGATISNEMMNKRILNSDIDFDEINERGEYYPNLEDSLGEFSRWVNLWDTFKWKKCYNPEDSEYKLGKAMGSIDKMYDNEKDVFFELKNILDTKKSLHNRETRNWIYDNYDKYEKLLTEVYKSVIDSDMSIRKVYTDSQENKTYNFAILPVEWKYSSSIKEMFIEEYGDVDCVVTFNKFGGTVYTKDGYREFPSYNLAEYIGTMYGLTGGGHPNAAGFKIHKEFPDFYKDDIDRCLDINLNRIKLALDEFMFELIEGGLHANFREIKN